MFKHVSAFAISTVMATAAFFAPPQALAAGSIHRAWVSGKGADVAGCGSPTNACRSFQYVVSNIIAPGGEIDVLDAAGYGAVTIPFALSIVNDGVGTAGVQQPTSGQNAITISAGSTDVVTLRGLNIDGLGAGSSGVGVISGGSIVIANCVIRHFYDYAISFQPTAGPNSLLVSNTVLSDNNTGLWGQTISLPAAGELITLKGVTANNNYTGIFVGYATATIVDSVMSNNVVGLSAEAPSNVYLERSTINNNGTGVQFQGGNSLATIYTYQNNNIDSNTTANISGGALTKLSHE